MIEQLDFSKSDGLLPVIVQHAQTLEVLMLGYMNQAAWEATMATQQVTFFSRSRQKLWVKGETSGNFLSLVSLAVDCDQDTLVAKVLPAGPTCHLGTTSCFCDHKKMGASDPAGLGFLDRLWQTIEDRYKHRTSHSYTSSLFEAGLDRVAQKVGEEAVETIIEAKNHDGQKFIDECSDLVYHLLVLLKIKTVTPYDLLDNLKKRHQPQLSKSQGGKNYKG